MHSQHTGLSSAQAKELLVRNGANEITQKPRDSAFAIFLSQFANILVILLIVAASASLFLGNLLDGIFILLIVFLNAIFGFVQEFKAEKAIEALKKMAVSKVRVERDGSEIEIDSRELVSGDLIVLEEGDKVPADCRLAEALHLEINEASLTGESIPVEKNIGDQDKSDIYLGTIVAKGRCRAKVVETGMNTKFGKIASSLSAIKDESTPLQKKLEQMSKQLGALAIIASIGVFILGVMQKQPFIEIILTSISLAVASVPEGLPAVITIALAVGMSRMARKKAILRKLSAIEALGNTTVIATDKTGTLTKNQMQVTKVWIQGEIFEVNSEKPLPVKNFEMLIKAGIYCNNAGLNKKENGEFEVLGDTTEGALLLLAQKKGIEIERIRKHGELLEEYPFDAGLKRMSVVWKNEDGEYIYSKGAPEMLLKKCKYIQEAEKTDDLTAEKREDIMKSLNDFAKEGLRVIALGFKKVERIPSSRESAENNLIFLGYVGISDPVRKEVKSAVLTAFNAGIRTVMITGDNELTAKAVAEKIGLLRDGFGTISGYELEKLSDKELLGRINKINIFARITPEQKLRIVQLLRTQKNIVAVTGDGVNDAPALKQADVGVAMGLTGTDVAKEASDMVITDDNYSTMVRAVEEGRIIFDNIKSAVKYLIACNIGEVIGVLVAMLFGWPLIFTPLQLLYINLITDGLPAIMLAIKPEQEGIMNRKPRRGNNFFERMDVFWVIEISSLTAIATVIAFYVGYRMEDVVLGRTLAFTVIVLIENFVFLDLWLGENSIFQINKMKNKIFLFSFVLPITLQLLLIYIPFLSEVFSIDSMSVIQGVFVLLLSLVLVFASEIRKSVRKGLNGYRPV